MSQIVHTEIDPQSKETQGKSQSNWYKNLITFIYFEINKMQSFKYTFVFPDGCVGKNNL